MTQQDGFPPGIVDGLILDQGVLTLYGQGGAAKSTLVLNLCCHVGAGMEFLGYKVVKGSSIYVAAERYETAKWTLRAWMRHREHDTDLVGLFRWQGLNLVSTDQAILDAKAKRAVELTERATKEKCRLLVFDTLKMSMLGFEESNDNFALVVGKVRKIAEDNQLLVVLIHHAGKDPSKGPRGGSSLSAHVDQTIFMRKVSTQGPPRGYLLVDKINLGDEGTIVAWRTKQIWLATNIFDRELTGIVIQQDLEATYEEFEEVGELSGKYQPELLEYIKLCLHPDTRDKNGNPTRLLRSQVGPADLPDYVEELTYWSAVEQVIEVHEGKLNHNTRQKWREALAKLMTKGYIGLAKGLTTRDNYIWLRLV